MNNSIRDNRNLLKKGRRQKLDKHLFVYKNLDLKKEEYDHIIRHTKVLKDIRDKLQKEKRQLFKKRIVAFCIISAVLISLLLL